MRFNPHPYQQEAIDFLEYRLGFEGQTGGGLFLDPGLGKTAIVLQLIANLRAAGQARRVLVVAPLRVVYSVWPAEVRKWGFPFKTQIIHGHKAKREKQLANREADIFLTNPESLDWLSRQRNTFFDLAVFDESTLFKTWMAKRTQAARRLIPRCRNRLILTGTPAPNGLADVFSQQYLIDDGESLGKHLTVFRQWAMNPVGNRQWNQWGLRPGAGEQIRQRIAPSVLTMRCEDHLDMPQLVKNEVWVNLPPRARNVYEEIEKSMFAELDAGQIIAWNAGAKYQICRGVANGGAYEEGERGIRLTHHLHDAKVDAIADIITELAGKPVMVAYLYNHDRERLQKRFKAPAIYSGTSAKEGVRLIDKWNAGQIPVLLVQPKALSHGANMQAGGADLIWCGLTNELEAYQQLNARLYRQGQTGGQVRIHHILARNTIDQAVWSSIQAKHTTQDGLKTALIEYRRQKGS